VFVSVCVRASCRVIECVYIRVCVRVCVRVCEREKEKERERESGGMYAPPIALPLVLDLRIAFQTLSMFSLWKMISRFLQTASH